MSSSAETDLPERMLRCDRPIDHHFEQTEKLYYRCESIHVADGRLLPQAFKFPNFSINRSKYSEPEDVLLPIYQKWGICSFRVKDLPEPTRTDESTIYEWRVVHDPLENNYSHSEVRTFKNGIFDQKSNIASTIKKKFRQVLSERAIICRNPEI